MEINKASNRIHPLMAGAAISVILVSLLGIAAISGILPSSQAKIADTPPAAAMTSTALPTSASTQQGIKRIHTVQNRPTQHAQVQTSSQASTVPQPAPVATNSPVGIGIGAVVGGLLGNQVGDGNGKTLATIAGAVGGGYVGNEIAKKNQ